MVENRAYGNPVRHLNRIFPQTRNIANHTKKKDANVHFAVIVTDCPRIKRVSYNWCKLMHPFVEARVRVRYAETDQMGIVYHSNYLIWMEIGRVEYCRSKGSDYRDIEADGILMVVAEANCRYASPARFDDEVCVRTMIVDANPRMVRFEYEIANSEGRSLATGFTKHVFCGRDGRPAKLPEKYRPLFGIGS
jgi:acyl-CoA thioester hydrolase